MTRYCIHLYTDNGWSYLERTKNVPYLALTGELWRVCCEKIDCEILKVHCMVFVPMFLIEAWAPNPLETNLALNHSATQHGGDSQSAGLAGDGIYLTGSCTVTPWLYQPWWSVDLGGTFEVDRVTFLPAGRTRILKWPDDKGAIKKIYNTCIGINTYCRHHYVHWWSRDHDICIYSLDQNRARFVYIYKYRQICIMYIRYWI